MTNQNNNRGFTIIEVVLVLAIAGLIFLMVFIALPALQRSQRDTQRRDDVARFMSQVNSFATNNRGNVPTNIDSFLDDYMKRANGEFRDPQTGDNYMVLVGADKDSQATTKTMVYATRAKCDGENIVANTASARSVAVKVRLEGSGSFCQDNQG